MVKAKREKIRWDRVIVLTLGVSAISGSLVYGILRLNETFKTANLEQNIITVDRKELDSSNKNQEQDGNTIVKVISETTVRSNIIPTPVDKYAFMPLEYDSNNASTNLSKDCFITLRSIK